jgi:cytochrome c oxidase assembly protein subunit 11
MSASPSLRTRNHKIAWIAAVTAIAMIGATYAAVPLYAEFCKRTGFAGTTQVAHNAPTIRGERSLVVRFDGNVSSDLDWTFEPETSSIILRTGATATVFFHVHNRSAKDTAAVAAYNVTPEVAGGWFDKISCFCFDEQRLGPGESADLPVVFFLDPALEQAHEMDDVQAVTLSYTLFAASGADKPVALAPRTPAPAPKL